LTAIAKRTRYALPKLSDGHHYAAPIGWIGAALSSATGLQASLS